MAFLIYEISNEYSGQRDLSKVSPVIFQPPRYLLRPEQRGVKSVEAERNRG
jgi:hypothetical protein